MERTGEFDLPSVGGRARGPGLPLIFHKMSGESKVQSPSKKVLKRRAVQKLCLFSFILLIILPCVAVSQDAPQPNQVGAYAIRSNVDLVVLQVTVRDHKGAPVSGLNREDFQVYEDESLQQIESFSHEDIPVTVGLVIDNSGSMARSLRGGWRGLGILRVPVTRRIRCSWSISTRCFAWPSG